MKNSNTEGIETFKFEIQVRVKGFDGKCIKHVFKEGFGPGVLARQIIEFDIKPHDLKSPMFAAELLHKQDEFRDSVIGTTIEEYDENEKGNSSKD